MPAPGTKHVLIRLPSPLYDYLLKMFHQEGSHWNDSKQTERGIVVDAKDAHGNVRQYLVVRTTQYRERSVKRDSTQSPH